eukprot:m.14087 g.14087  ORF g.14087 m.14087 type:complete len:270 (-) comp7035_c0_seq2:29-838(-)
MHRLRTALSITARLSTTTAAAAPAAANCRLLTHNTTAFLSFSNPQQHRNMASSGSPYNLRSTTTGASGTDILSHLKMRHQEVDAELSALCSAAVGASAAGTDDQQQLQQRRDVLDQLVHDLAVHTAVEELVFYPAIQRELGEQDAKLKAAVDSLLEEHHAAKTVLDELYAMGPKDERFHGRAKVLADNVREHVQEEEQLFPELQRLWPLQRLRELCEEFVTAEQSAPTRPHPAMPDQGRFVASMQYVMAAFDKIKDSARDALKGGSKTA